MRNFNTYQKMYFSVAPSYHFAVLSTAIDDTEPPPCFLTSYRTHLSLRCEWQPFQEAFRLASDRRHPPCYGACLRTSIPNLPNYATTINMQRPATFSLSARDWPHLPNAKESSAIVPNIR